MGLRGQAARHGISIPQGSADGQSPARAARPKAYPPTPCPFIQNSQNPLPYTNNDNPYKKSYGGSGREGACPSPSSSPSGGSPAPRCCRGIDGHSKRGLPLRTGPSACRKTRHAAQVEPAPSALRAAAAQRPGSGTCLRGKVTAAPANACVLLRREDRTGPKHRPLLPKKQRLLPTMNPCNTYSIAAAPWFASTTF